MLTEIWVYNELRWDVALFLSVLDWLLLTESDINYSPMTLFQVTWYVLHSIRPSNMTWTVCVLSKIKGK